MATETPNQIFTLRLQGRISDAAVKALGGKRRGNVAEEVTVVIEVRDRSELHSILQRVEQLGLDLISAMPQPDGGIGTQHTVDR